MLTKTLKFLNLWLYFLYVKQMFSLLEGEKIVNLNK